LACGSDSTTGDVQTIVSTSYNREFLDHHKNITGGTIQAALEIMRSNLDWFADHRASMPGNSFLDVGHCEGSALYGMQERGFAVHGFDIIPECCLGTHTTIAPFFAASLFPQRYSAVMAREVIEHIDPWRQFLNELYDVTAQGGFCQIQTPRPTAKPNPIGHQERHLQLFSPYLLRAECERRGFRVVDFRLWNEGQAWLLRK
jgi:2-polyprenyl-3-methyl-5-hydroxy-6-metoxy-1,4-benzoquinol methylase